MASRIAATGVTGDLRSSRTPSPSTMAGDVHARATMWSSLGPDRSGRQGRRATSATSTSQDERDAASSISSAAGSGIATPTSTSQSAGCSDPAQRRRERRSSPWVDDRRSGRPDPPARSGAGPAAPRRSRAGRRCDERAADRPAAPSSRTRPSYSRCRTWSRPYRPRRATRGIVAARSGRTRTVRSKIRGSRVPSARGPDTRGEARDATRGRPPARPIQPAWRSSGRSPDDAPSRTAMRAQPARAREPGNRPGLTHIGRAGELVSAQRRRDALRAPRSPIRASRRNGRRHIWCMPGSTGQSHAAIAGK